MPDPEDIIDPDDDGSISELVDSLSSDTDSMMGLSAGLDPELASDLRSITKGTGRRSTVTIRPRGRRRRSAMDASPDVDPDTFEVEVNHDHADSLLTTVYQRIQDVSDEYGHPEMLVLGKPQFAVLEPWSQAEHYKPIEQTLPVDRVIVVDGPMIQPVVPNDVMLAEYLQEKDE